MMHRILIALALLLRPPLQSPVAPSAHRIRQAPPSVTFQVEVNYVDVDVVVTDEEGNFISGLTREDFEVFEDGKPQKVDMFSLGRDPGRAGRRVLLGDRQVSIDAQSNRLPFAGRLYVIVLDDRTSARCDCRR